MNVSLSPEEIADSMARIARFTKQQAEIENRIPPLVTEKWPAQELNSVAKSCKPRAETPHRARLRLRAWEIARGWSQQELAGMLSRLIWRLDSRRLRPSEAHRVQGIAVLVSTALVFAESLSRADSEFRRNAINEPDRARVGEQFAQFFDELADHFHAVAQTEAKP